MGAAQQVGQQVLAEADFVRRKPGRERTAENRTTADTPGEVLHSRRRMRMSGAICWTSAERARPSIASPRQRPWAQLSRSDNMSLPKPTSLVANHAESAPPRIELRRIRPAKFSIPGVKLP